MNLIYVSIAILAALISVSARTATTGMLFLKGTVPSILSIAIAPEPLASTLPLDASQSGALIAVVTERSNSKDGYKIQISSQNLGKLVLNATHFVPYTLTYGGQAVNLTTGTEFNRSFVSAAPIDKNVNISYTGNTNLPAGDYTDNITFTITAN